MLSLIMQTEPSVIMTVLEQYGPLGIGFAVLLTIMIRQNKNAQKRIQNLEEQQQEQYKAHIADQKAMINDYVDLVRNKTQVLSDLTGCLKAIKSTLERMERRSE